MTMRRAAERQTSAATLVALADPEDNLAAAVSEISEIARTFPADDVTLAMRGDATVDFLQAHVCGADYLHLACHARGGLFDSADAAIELADGTMTALELTELPGITTRLVVISACQSALSEIAGMPDEVVSIGTAMVAAGSACAIASLWSVDDAATALLMVRVYEEIRRNGLRPPEALRKAQLWLRDLTAADERVFLDAHPTLRNEFRRRAATGDPPGRRSGAGAPTPTVRPYAHPDVWAPFIAVGA
jgi:CHAT domain-containing protein